MHNYNVEITPELLKKHKINETEYSVILQKLGRTPNLVELGVFSAMWSEHCSYKSTRIHLKKMHTTGECVICGPGENAGVIDVGDGDACVFKMESHNHPSYIEPFNGSATGVGGILRDVFTMGARPIANVNALRFGAVNHQKTQQLVNGVVSGISFYGNCVGVPMVAGETNFDSSYNGNILVNAMSVGVCKADKIFYSAASKVGAKVVYFGSKTGRDGIHGASMSSDSFDSKAKSQKPTVQVGDPFTEKLLIEACLELMASGCVSAIQDMGAAGLTCSSVEMAGKGGTGIDIEISKVPMRETGMSAYEVMLSESQERMLMILNDGMEDTSKAILQKWNLDFAIIGEITNSERLVVREGGKEVCNLPLGVLSENAPIYERPFEVKIDNSTTLSKTNKKDNEFKEVLLKILSHPDIVNKKSIWERYDRGVQNRSILSCGESAGLVTFGEEYEIQVNNDEVSDKNYITSQVLLKKQESGSCGIVDFITDTNNSSKVIKYKTKKALAITSDCTPRYVNSDAFEGAKQAVAESYRNICAVGATPLAITNCLNFGNPEKTEVMGQIVRAIDGISEAAKTLNYPVISGNVSLYNETNGVSIKPTPTIGGVGILHDCHKYCSIGFKHEGDMIFVIGSTEGHLSNTIYANCIANIAGGKCPSVNLTLERQTGDFIVKSISAGLINACSDVSNGGIAVTISKMILSGGVGCSLGLDGKTNGLPLVDYMFAEDQARYIVSVAKENGQKFIENAIESNMIASHIGFVCGTSLNVDDVNISISDITTANNAKLF